MPKPKLTGEQLADAKALLEGEDPQPPSKGGTALQRRPLDALAGAEAEILRLLLSHAPEGAHEHASCRFDNVFVYTRLYGDDRLGRAERQQNLAKHGLDFADLDEWFFLEAVTVPAKDGRHMAIGRLADGTVAVVYALLGAEGVSIISMRPASRKERSLL